MKILTLACLLFGLVAQAANDPKKKEIIGCEPAKL